MQINRVKKDSNSISQRTTSTSPDKQSADTLAITDSSLLCYLPFNSNLRDKSGHGNNGKLIGSISYVADRFGSASKAVSFAASNTYIEIPETDFVGLKAATIALNFYPTSNNQQELVSKMSYDIPIGYPGFYQSFSFVFNSTSSVAFSIRQSGACSAAVGTGWSPPIYSYGNVVLNTWNQIAITYNNLTQKIYLNGTLMGTGSKTSSPLCPGGPIRLGVWWQGEPIYFTGNMDEVRIYNRVLARTEIKALWKSVSN